MALEGVSEDRCRDLDTCGRAVDLRLGTRPVGTGAVGAGGPSDVDAWDTENGRDCGTSPRDKEVWSDGKGHWKPMK